MTEQSIFLAALEIDDPAARAVYLEKACDDDSALRRQVASLLEAHERSGEFLNVPAVEQIGADHPQFDESTKTFNPGAENEAVTAARNNYHGLDDTEESVLPFLQPSSRSDSMGRLGHYEVLEILGQGGFGIVVKAFDEKLHRAVAIKVMSAQLAATSPARKRFVREARSSASVRHEHVVAIHAVEEQPIPHLVMEYIAGETLQQKLDRSGPLEVPEVLRLGRQIADGLAAAHAMGLIHRDIKPSNILLESGVEQRVKITDFGLARAADDASLTQSGVIAGTPMYMAPEQAAGDVIDQRADLFSLGSVLYVMCTGRPPFRASTTLAVLKRVAEDTPRPIREIIPEVPEWLCAIVEKLHAKKPEDRFQTATELADLLRQHLAHERQPGLVPMPARVQPLVAPATMSTPQRGTWNQIFEATDRTKRLVQLGLIALGILLILTPLYGLFQSSGNGLAMLGGLVLCGLGGIFKQRCTVAYKGRLIRFENSGVVGKLFIDGMLVARGRMRSLEDLCAVIPGGPGAGDQIRVSAHAGLGPFVCRIFAAEGRSLPEPAIPTLQPPVRPRRWKMAATALTVIMLAAFWFWPAGMRYANDRAEVEYTPEPGLTSVIVLHNDASVNNCMVLAAGRTIQLSPGKYRINHRFSKPGLDIRWEVTRHGLFASQKSVPGGSEFDLEVKRGERITVHAVIWDNGTVLWDDPARPPFSGSPLLEGRWTVLREETSGTEPPSISKWWEFKGPIRLHKFDAKDDPAQCEYRIDTTQTPPQIDLISNGQILRRGIYELKGDELTVCFSTPREQRPKTFVTRQNTSLYITVLRRERISRPDEEQLQGTWTPIKGTWFKMPFSPEELKGGRMIFDGEGLRLIIPKDLLMQGTFKLDSTKKPKELTFVIADTDVSTRRMDGIYELNGDTLRICFGYGPRPKDFVDAQSILNFVFKRKAPAADKDGFVQLFNGKNLTGWKTHPDAPGEWKVADGILINDKKPGYLFSERGDYENFHLRVEAKINADGDSGVFFRSRLHPLIEQKEGKGKSPTGYEAQIGTLLPARTGSLYLTEKPGHPGLFREERLLTPAGEWFTLEVIANGPWITVDVNGKRTAYVKNEALTRGYIALQAYDDKTTVQFRKVEIKELPSGKGPP